MDDSKGTVDEFLERRAVRSPDPFFQSSTSTSDAERATLVRAVRADARLRYRSSSSRASHIVVAALFFPMLFLSLWVFVPAGYQWAHDPSNGAALRGFVFTLVYAAIGWYVVVWAWKLHRRVTSALLPLAAELGGSVGRNQYLAMLDWLDANWLAETPMDDVEPPGNFDWRWTLRTKYRGLPLLVSVHRRAGTKYVAPVRRISFYLAAPSASSGAGYDPAPGLQKLEASGFWAKKTPAGVYACHSSIEPKMLERESLLRGFEMARAMLGEGTLVTSGGKRG